MTTTNTERLIHDVQSIHELTGLSKQFIWTLIYKGELRSFKIGKRRFVSHDDFTAWLAAKRDGDQGVGGSS